MTVESNSVVLMNSTAGKLLYTVPPESDRRPPNPGADPDFGDADRSEPSADARSGSDPDVRPVRPTRLPRIDCLSSDLTSNRSPNAARFSPDSASDD